MDEALILLTKKSNKLLLKFHGASITTDERDGSTKVLRYCPIVVLTAVEVKDDPTGNFLSVVICLQDYILNTKVKLYSSLRN